MASDANNLIHKRNLWKFLKMVQVQNRPVYKIMAEVPSSVIWIDVLVRDSGDVIQTIPVSEFISMLPDLPTRGTVYRITFRTYSFLPDEYEISEGENLYTATLRQELTLDILPSFISYMCYQKVKSRAPSFLECIEDIKKYNLTRKDIERLTPYTTQCNRKLIDKL